MEAELRKLSQTVGSQKNDRLSDSQANHPCALRESTSNSKNVRMKMIGVLERLKKLVAPGWFRPIMSFPASDRVEITARTGRIFCRPAASSASGWRLFERRTKTGSLNNGNGSEIDIQVCADFAV